MLGHTIGFQNPIPLDTAPQPQLWYVSNGVNTASATVILFLTNGDVQFLPPLTVHFNVLRPTVNMPITLRLMVRPRFMWAPGLDSLPSGEN